jgi:hypothetical protein
MVEQGRNNTLVGVLLDEVAGMKWPRHTARSVKVP